MAEETEQKGEENQEVKDDSIPYARFKAEKDRLKGKNSELESRLQEEMDASKQFRTELENLKKQQELYQQQLYTQNLQNASQNGDVDDDTKWRKTYEYYLNTAIETANYSKKKLEEMEHQLKAQELERREMRTLDDHLSGLKQRFPSMDRDWVAKAALVEAERRGDSRVLFSDYEQAAVDSHEFNAFKSGERKVAPKIVRGQGGSVPPKEPAGYANMKEAFASLHKRFEAEAES